MIIRIDYDNNAILIDEEKITDDSIFFDLPLDTRNIHKFLIEITNMLVGEYRKNEKPSISIESQDDGEISIIEDY